MKRIAASLAFASLFALGSCEKGNPFKIPAAKDLEPGGVFIAYNLGCEKGCEQIGKGDLLQKIDGKTVKTGEEFDAANVTDGKPHKLELLTWQTHAPKTVEITATPK